MTLWDFAKEAPIVFWWLVFMTVAVIAYFILRILNMVASGKIKTKWISKGDDQDHPPEEEHHINTHEGCPHYPDIKNIIHEATTNSSKITRIQSLDILRDQMAEVELTMMDIKKKFMKVYFTGLATLRGTKEGLIGSRDVAHYTEIMDNLEIDSCGVMLKFMKQNHFTDKTEDEFVLYVQKKIKYLQEHVTDELNTRYESHHFEMSRESLFELNTRECLAYSNEKLRELFYKVREISKKYFEEIERLENISSQLMG